MKGLRDLDESPGGGTSGAAGAHRPRSANRAPDSRHAANRTPGRGRPAIRMVPEVLEVEGRALHFAVSDNADAVGPDGPGSPVIWAVNVHGYFAGGRMYWRESARLAEATGWRVINPSLPGFGGSDPLAWSEVSMSKLAEQVDLILEHVGGGPAVILGHSMGGAVAVQYAHENPARTIGVIYRDGVATPAWKRRRGILPVILSAIAPGTAPIADLLAAVAIDAPDLLIGRMNSTLRSLLPDIRHNIRTMDRTLPVGSMLMVTDLREEVRGLRASGIPVLAEWGCFDRVANATTAAEFSEIAGVEIQWVPGGHSWMLARPAGQADVLTHLRSGREFERLAVERWRRLVPPVPSSVPA